jgi:hypothetical protein
LCGKENFPRIGDNSLETFRDSGKFMDGKLFNFWAVSLSSPKSSSPSSGPSTTIAMLIYEHMKMPHSFELDISEGDFTS